MSTRLPAAPSRTALAKALTASGLCGDVVTRELIELPRRGLAHRHWRVRGRGLLLRVPLAANGDALTRQAETFRRMAPSSHVPRLEGLLPPGSGLPGGALLVEEIRGRAPVVPRDLASLAAALAAIHDLPVPPAEARPPLPSPEEPFAATLATIDRHLAQAGPSLSPDIRAKLAAARDRAGEFARNHAAELAAAPRALVITDAHPRNFVLTAGGRAICVDLEKAIYGSPAIDLAHAVLPAAIAWGRTGERVTEANCRRFLAVYFNQRGPAAEAALRPLLEPARHLVWLRTTAAFAAFRASGAERVLGPAARRLARRAIARALDGKAMPSGG